MASRKNACGADRQEPLAFLDDDQVSPYHHHAEQQMRLAVLTRKISQQNRSADGAKATPS